MKNEASRLTPQASDYTRYAPENEFEKTGKLNNRLGSVNEVCHAREMTNSSCIHRFALRAQLAMGVSAKNTFSTKQSQFLLCRGPKNKAKTNPFKANK
ncbi:MAG: hypothetical protein WCD79_11220 [Chthoniobacteraceae bacterium]